MKREFIHACIASLVLLVLSFWLLGFKLETDGTRFGGAVPSASGWRPAWPGTRGRWVSSSRPNDRSRRTSLHTWSACRPGIWPRAPSSRR